MSITPLDQMATIPLRGRDVQFETTKQIKRPKSELGFETPILPFEKDVIRKTTSKKSTKSSISKGSLIDRTPKNSEGLYAMRFSDSTWSTTSTNTKDQPPTKEYVQGLLSNYEKNLNLVEGYRGVDKAARVQAINDLMLDELINQLRVTNLGQAKLLEKSRGSYSEIFNILHDDASASRDEIIRLQEVAEKAVLDKEMAIRECDIKIENAEEEARNKIQEMRDLLNQKMEQYDNDMKSFLEQKARLEDHVKALHHVFLDFQSDAVYLKLEELKQQLNKEQRRTLEKEEDISRLQLALGKWKEQHEQMQAKQTELEAANNALRNQLQELQLKNSKLERQIEFLKADLDPADDESETSEYVTANSSLLDEIKDLIDDKEEPNVHVPLVIHNKRKKKGQTSMQLNTMQFAALYEEISVIGKMLVEFIEKATGNSVEFIDKADDAEEMKLLSGNLEIIQGVIENRILKVKSLASSLNNIEPRAERVIKIGTRTSPRFVQYFSSGIAGKPAAKKEKTRNIYSEMRHLFTAKYLADKWNKRAGRKMVLFPEFVLSYYYEEEGRMCYALHECKRLWQEVNAEETAEAKLFVKFLSEEYNADELSVFLEMRNALVGFGKIDDDANSSVRVGFTRCKELLDEVLGTLSPINSAVSKAADKISDHGSVDHAEFLQVFLDYYNVERQQRREAVKIMVQSKKYNNDIETPIYVELFVSMVLALGFQGSMDDVLEFYRYSQILSGGELSIDGILEAMDEIGIHFYSIDLQIERDTSFDGSEASRRMVSEHWLRINQWFEGLKKNTKILEPWAKRTLLTCVRRAEQTFQNTQSAARQFYSVRNLLDQYQYVLGLISRGATCISREQGENQLKFLESLCENLLDIVIGATK